MKNQFTSNYTSLKIIIIITSSRSIEMKMKKINTTFKYIHSHTNIFTSIRYCFSHLKLKQPTNLLLFSLLLQCYYILIPSSSFSFSCRTINTKCFFVSNAHITKIIKHLAEKCTENCFYVIL